MATKRSPRNLPNEFDRNCDRCRRPMVGIMKVTNGRKPPRTICVDCEEWPGEGRGVRKGARP